MTSDAWVIVATYVGLLTSDQAETIGECLSRHDGMAANLPPDRFTVSIYQDGHGPEMVAPAIALINKSVAASAAPTDGLCAIEVVTEAELEHRTEQPNYPDLVSAGEAAEILNVKRQRVHQLAAQGRGFPEPLYELAVGKLWETSAIEAFAKQRNKTPGRPKAPKSSTDAVSIALERAAKLGKAVARKAERRAGVRGRSMTG